MVINMTRACLLAALTVCTFLYPSSVRAEGWVRNTQIGANFFDFSIGNSEICVVYDNGSGPNLLGGDTQCWDSNSNAIPNTNFAPNAYPHGYAERVAVGPMDPVSQHSTEFVASSDGFVYLWTGHSWTQAASQPSGFPQGPSRTGPGPNDTIAVAKLVYEPYVGVDTGDSLELAVPENPLWLLGANGHVYRISNYAKFPGGNFDFDTGLTNVWSLSYSPYSLAMWAYTSDGGTYMWSDSQVSWIFMGFKVPPSVETASVAGANMMAASGYFAALSTGPIWCANPPQMSPYGYCGGNEGFNYVVVPAPPNVTPNVNGYMSCALVNGCTSFTFMGDTVATTWLDGIATINFIDLDFASQTNTAYGNTVMSITEGSAMANLLEWPGIGIPYPPGGNFTFGGPMTFTDSNCFNGYGIPCYDVLWILTSNFRIYVFVAP